MSIEVDKPSLSIAFYIDIVGSGDYTKTIFWIHGFISPQELIEIDEQLGQFILEDSLNVEPFTNYTCDLLKIGDSSCWQFINLRKIYKN